MKYICNEDGEKEALIISMEKLNEFYSKKVFYYYSIKGIRAIGYWNEGEFYLCKGSKIKGELSGNKFSPANKNRVKSFLEKGLLEKHNDYYLVLEDISTGGGKDSAAASIVAGGNKSNVEWGELPHEDYLKLAVLLKHNLDPL